MRLEVAQLVERRFREHPSSSVTQAQVKAAETAGDTITRDLITLLNTQYLTRSTARTSISSRRRSTTS